MLYLLLLITLCFLLVNYLVSDYDYMHPSVFFLLIFFVYEIVCVCGAQIYAITLHINTVLVLTTAFLVMTIANFITIKTGRRRLQIKIELKEIRIPKYYLRFLVLLQLLSIAFFYIYLRRIAAAYGDSYGPSPDSLSGMIKLYDTLTKFWVSIYSNLAVSIPLVYRIANPICAGAEYIVLYIMVNNYLIKKKKINKWEVMILILMCVRIIMNGSRSPLLRIFTFIFLLVYVLNYRRGKFKKGNLKFLGKLIAAAACFGVAMFLVLIIMGRTANFTGVGYQLFVYLGAPIVNLDSFIESNAIGFFSGVGKNTLFGAQTFKGLYAYLGKLFHIAEFQSIPSISIFTFSSNGIEIGNVYTMFYMIIYDFGFFGVIPMTFIMGLYYCRTYKKVIRSPMNRAIDFRLLIYAYLFNDIVMSAFSTRFYETVFDAPFIKFYIMAWVVDMFFVERKVRLRGKSTVLVENRVFG